MLRSPVCISGDALTHITGVDYTEFEVSFFLLNHSPEGMHLWEVVKWLHILPKMNTTETSPKGISDSLCFTAGFIQDILTGSLTEIRGVSLDLERIRSSLICSTWRLSIF